MKHCWSRNQLGAWVCKLGSLNKAIVLVLSKKPGLSPLRWRISISSHLPFSDDQYRKEFTTHEECAKYAESIVLEWLNSLTVVEDLTGIETPLGNQYGHRQIN